MIDSSRLHLQNCTSPHHNITSQLAPHNAQVGKYIQVQHHRNTHHHTHHHSSLFCMISHHMAPNVTTLVCVLCQESAWNIFDLLLVMLAIYDQVVYFFWPLGPFSSQRIEKCLSPASHGAFESFCRRRTGSIPRVSWSFLDPRAARA